MPDPMLETLAQAANDQGASGQTISLLVGGFLVSGLIIGIDEFLRNHMNVEPDPSPDPNSAGEQAPNFIHLRDAQCLGGLGVVPSDKGMYLRISIASINGFSLTRIHRGAKK